MRLDLRSSRMHRKWCNMYHHNHADNNGRIRLSIVVMSCRRSGLGRRTYRTPPRIDFAVTLFSLIIMNLCLDVRLCWKVVDLFCFIVMNLCLDGTLWWKIATLWWRRFIVMNLCLDASSDCVIVSTCYVWSYECVNLFWLRLVTPGVSATPGVSNQSCHSVWCDWHHESRQTVWCN
jgi:hypothetical protein